MTKVLMMGTPAWAARHAIYRVDMFYAVGCVASEYSCCPHVGRGANASHQSHLA